MVQPVSTPQVTFAEYLAMEVRSEIKHEYLDGRVYAMSGGTPAHARLSAKVLALFDAQLAGRPCATFTSDLRIRVRATSLATHPDVTVVCGKLEHDPEDPHSVTNPIVIVEVLSPSTESYDRQEKFAHYRRIPSLQAYVLVSQDERRVEVHTRNADTTWNLRDVREGAARIEAIGCELPIESVYRDPLG